MADIREGHMEPPAAVTLDDEFVDQDEAFLVFLAAAVATTNTDQEQQRRRTWDRRGTFRETAFRQPVGRRGRHARDALTPT